jgi:hypothetical protein
MIIAAKIGIIFDSCNKKKGSLLSSKKEGRLNHFLVSSALMPQRASPLLRGQGG